MLDTCPHLCLSCGREPKRCATFSRLTRKEYVVHIRSYVFVEWAMFAPFQLRVTINFGNAIDSLVSAGSVLRTLDWGT